jgi:hypothetical protein
MHSHLAMHSQPAVGAGLAVLGDLGEALAGGLDLGLGGAPVGPRLGAHLLARLERQGSR